MTFTTKRRRRIAVIVGTSSGWGRRLIRGIFKYTQRHGPWDILIRTEEEKAASELRNEPHLDGIIARVSSESMAAELKQHKVPVINVSGLLIGGDGFPRVTTSWDASIDLVLDHFRDRGIENFAYVGPTRSAHVDRKGDVSESVFSKGDSGFRIFALKETTGPNGVLTDYTEELVSWLEWLPKPVGVYTWGVQVGRIVASACIDSGIPIPHDIAILGSDYDDLFYESCHPALSGIVVPTGRVGYLAAKNLSLLMEGKALERENTFVLPEEIKSRLSTDTLAISDRKMKRAISFLRAHACEGIEVKDVLDEVGMSRRSLERRFIEYLGRSPAQEIRRIRINEARSLLARTNLSLDEVAESCGYASYTYLGTVFKKETGVTPGRYRRVCHDPDSGRTLTEKS
ncbi:MAG: helix-turn-helix domain-containing protein [Verrucomicrobiota bacterium]